MSKLACPRVGWVDLPKLTPECVQVREQRVAWAEHEPLGELYPYGDDDRRPLDLILVEISDGPAPPEEQRGRFCVCKHCNLVYWSSE